MEARHGPEYEYESVGTSCTKMWRQVGAPLYGDSHPTSTRSTATRASARVGRLVLLYLHTA